MREVAYLSHVISEVGVAMDQQKVCAVLEWLVSSSVWAVLAFPRLAGYYRQFIKDYGSIAEPFSRLLRKEGFKWCIEA
jgi:hypothetical protein